MQTNYLSQPLRILYSTVKGQRGFALGADVSLEIWAIHTGRLTPTDVRFDPRRHEVFAKCLKRRC